MLRVGWCVVASISLVVGLSVRQDDGQQKPAEQAATAPAESPNQKALRQVVDDMAAAANARQVDKLVAGFAEDAEMIDDEGEVHRGRAEIKDAFDAFFSAFPDVVTKLDVRSVQMVGSDVAVLHGVKSTECKSQGSSAGHQFTIVFHKTDGKWLVANIREFSDDPELTPRQHLEALAWLVGEWIDESPEVEVHAKVKWSDDKNYLIGTYTVQRDGQKLLSTTQRIGWDPMNQKIRTWYFDSDGGFGDGLWTKTADGWMAKVNGVLPDGRPSSATFHYTSTSKDRFEWRSTDRIVGDEAEEDRNVVIVRKAPAPGK